jgi:hypothetical protein
VAVLTYTTKRGSILRVFKRKLVLMIFKPLFREVVIKRTEILQVFTRPIRPW